MRLWSFHPKYLDPRGLVAVWREGLLALHVLQNKTTGYRNHPQLQRFKESPSPIRSLSYYLHEVCKEGLYRGYTFNDRKIPKNNFAKVKAITVTQKQVYYEWQHFKKKLKIRNKSHLKTLVDIDNPAPHPLFRVIDGEIEQWKRV